MENNINLENSEIAYSYKSNGELRFTYFIFKILQRPKLLKAVTLLANWIINFNLPLKFFIKNTVFKVFCAGEDIDSAFLKIKYLERFKVRSVLDYVSEGEENEEAFDKTAAIITDNIVRLGKECPGNYVSVKISGLENPEFLTYCNRRDFQGDGLSVKRFDKLMRRIDSICNTASRSGIIVFIDAEDRCMQDLFDKITETMMEKYNKGSAVIFNTLQMYLKDRPAYLKFLIEDAKQKKYVPGIKLVRGAYVEKEREKAFKEGKSSPVFDTKKETDEAFDQAIELCLSEHNSVDTCIATHNTKSTMHAIDCIKKFNIRDHFTKVRFSQLFGMSDNLTFNLGIHKYNASKYLPYGEVKKAIPYLIRRSEENSSIDGQITDELVRLKSEIERRKSD